MIRKLVDFLAIFLLMILHGCQSAKVHGLAERDRALQATLSERWEKAANNADWNALASTYTTDAILLPPNGPAVAGRERIKNFFAGFPPISDMSLKLVEIGGSGDVAYVRGVYTMIIRPPNANPIAEVGKYLEIRKRQPDGSWLISCDMFSSDLPASH